MRTTSVTPGERRYLADPALEHGASGLNPQTITLNMGTVDGSDGMTQFDSASTQISSKVDGALFGSLSGVSVDCNGYVTAQFTNGLTQKIYKLPVATFSNPDGLAATSGNAYATSQDSGTPTISPKPIRAAPARSSRNRSKARRSIWPTSLPT